MKRLAYPLLVTGAIVACGEGHRAFEGTETPPFDVDGGGLDAGVCGVRCSRDLHSIVDGCDESKIVEECAPADGCAEGQCRPACEAAVGANASVGCEFIALPAPRSRESDGSCFAVFVANTWGIPTRVEAEYAGKPLDVTKSGRIVRTDGADVRYEPFDGEIKPGQVAILFLSEQPSGNPHHVACPEGVQAAIQSDTALGGTRRGSTFRIKTAAPVSAYSISPFGGAKSYIPTATLLLPLSSWKTDYVVTNPWETLYPDSLHVFATLYPTTSIVAADDNTVVTVVPSVHVQGGLDVEDAEKAVAKTYSLRRGEQLQFSQDDELTGTRIAANKRIGVWGGHECMFVPRSEAACDASQVELFPLQTWGHEYAVVPYRSRAFQEGPEEYFYRITGAVDGTKLTYDPSPPPAAPAEVNAGQSLVMTTREPFVVKSQDAEHPFAAYMYMSGGLERASANDGDPEFVPVVPTEQYLGRYIFFVDPTYPNSQLIVVRARDGAKSFEPVTLGCAGTLDGWTPLGTAGTHEYIRLRLTKDGAPQRIGTGTCTTGRHEIESAGPVGITVWGSGRYASYGYPGGAALRAVNTVQSAPILK